LATNIETAAGSRSNTILYNLVNRFLGPLHFVPLFHPAFLFRLDPITVDLGLPAPAVSAPAHPLQFRLAKLDNGAGIIACETQ
jgi:hypothetical protein